LNKLGYKEIQRIFKEIAKRAIFDKNFRELCLTDSVSAIEEIMGIKVTCPYNVLFLEEDRRKVEGVDFPYVLPPFVGQTWLSGNK